MKKANFSVIFAVLLCFSLSPAAWAAQVVPGGMTVGIELKTDGVMVSRVTGVDTHEGTFYPAKEAGLEAGDCIIRFAGAEIHSGEDFMARAAELNGSDISVTVRRDDEERTMIVTPAQNKSGDWQLGLWLRDGASGIGTVTYYDPDSGEYGALGHGVNDMDSGKIFPAADGRIFPSQVAEVVKGKAGKPGQLHGVFEGGAPMGDICSNTPFGIFGVMEGLENTETVETARAEEIKPGSISILSNVDGDRVCEYEAQLLRVNCNARDGKSFLIKITDEKLLDATGGVVCGMSGSPIFQNGKLIGAVTHVMVNDPTRGYGIFIDKMMEAAA